MDIICVCIVYSMSEVREIEIDLKIPYYSAEYRAASGKRFWQKHRSTLCCVRYFKKYEDLFGPELTAILREHHSDDIEHLKCICDYRKSYNRVAELGLVSCSAQEFYSSVMSHIETHGLGKWATPNESSNEDNVVAP